MNYCIDKVILFKVQAEMEGDKQLMEDIANFTTTQLEKGKTGGKVGGCIKIIIVK